MPALLLVFFTSILAGIMVQSVPRHEAAVAESKADFAAVQLFAYKRALLDYLAANSSYANGTIPDYSLNLPTGLSRQHPWTHQVIAGQLYIYESSPSMRTGLVDTLYVKTSNSLLVGSALQGKFVDARGYNSWTLPAQLAGLSDRTVIVVGR